MKIRALFAAASIGVILAVFSPSVFAADEDAALLARMAGNYRDNAMVFRTESTGTPPSYVNGGMTLRLPRGKGVIRGTLIGPGVSFPMTGQVIKVRSVGRKVQYSGRLRVVSPGLTLSQTNFRATASPRGATGEVLVSGIRLSASSGGISGTLSTAFRGVK